MTSVPGFGHRFRRPSLLRVLDTGSRRRSLHCRPPLALQRLPILRLGGDLTPGQVHHDVLRRLDRNAEWHFDGRRFVDSSCAASQQSDCEKKSERYRFHGLSLVVNRKRDVIDSGEVLDLLQI